DYWPGSSAGVFVMPAGTRVSRFFISDSVTLKRHSCPGSSESECDDIRNVGEGTNRTLAHEASKASLTEVLRPKPTRGHEVIVGFLQHGMVQPAVPFAPCRH